MERWIESHLPWLVPFVPIIGGWLGRRKLGSIWRWIDRLNNQAKKIASLENELQLCANTRDYIMAALAEITHAAELTEVARLRESPTKSAPSSAKRSFSPIDSPSSPSDPAS